MHPSFATPKTDKVDKSIAEMVSMEKDRTHDIGQHVIVATLFIVTCAKVFWVAWLSIHFSNAM